METEVMVYWWGILRTASRQRGLLSLEAISCPVIPTITAIRFGSVIIRLWPGTAMISKGKDE
jgi:hypothetical protein